MLKKTNKSCLKKLQKASKKKKKKERKCFKKTPFRAAEGTPPRLECDCLASVSFISLFLAPTSLVQWLEEAGLEETCDASLQLGDRKPWIFFVAFEGFEGPKI